MRINNNMLAMNTHRQLGVSSNAGAKSMEKLSSGFRINRAGDDAAGLSISEKMRGQIRGLTQASRNAQDGISLIQTAEGALNETHAILQRIRELAVQSSTDTNTGADRGEIQKEVDELAKEVTRIAESTQFNTMNLLDGTYTDKKFHIGANAAQDVTMKVENMDAKSLTITSNLVSGTVGAFDINGRDVSGVSFILASDSGIATSAKVSGTQAVVTLQNSGAASAATINSVKSALEGIGFSASTATAGDTIVAGVAAVATDIKESGLGINVSHQSAASTAITTVNDALGKVSSERSKLGAMQNRLEHTIKNLDTSAENLQASESRIRDVDMAKEMMEQTKQNILQQASTAMLAQANQAPQTVLQLLR